MSIKSAYGMAYIPSRAARQHDVHRANIYIFDYTGIIFLSFLCFFVYYLTAMETC